MDKNPCTGCVPPKRNEDCHAKCESYLAWAEARRIERQKTWQYKESVNYTSKAMLELVKRKQMGKGPRIRRHSDS